MHANLKKIKYSKAFKRERIFKVWKNQNRSLSHPEVTYSQKNYQTGSIIYHI